MTLADVLTTLEEIPEALPASRVKDIKTAIKYLAAALGAASPEQCPVDAALAQEATWAHGLEAHFATLETQGRTISVVTRRNTRNNLRKLLRAAEKHGLLTAPLPLRLLKRPNLEAWRREQYATQPYPATYGQQRRRYWLPKAEWPADIVQGWQTYQVRCGLRIRKRSFDSYVKLLETYFGYLAHICHRVPTWEDCFSVETLTAFVRWHSERLGRDLTTHARQVVIWCAAAANVLGHPNRTALATFRQRLKKPEAVHDKRLHHWVSLAKLEEVAEACLAEGRAPLVPAGRESQHQGAQRAGRFQRGLILKILVRIPLRQRNIREMQLHKNLVQDPTTKHWHLHFQGTELKISHRGPEVNVYTVNLSTTHPELIGVLNEYLTVHRPKLPNATTSRYVFLTQRGNPHIDKTLHLNLAEAVAMHTGQRFYPHLIRTIWAMEVIEKGKERAYAMAAARLGDQVSTVIKVYQNIVEAEQHANAAAFLSTALHPKAERGSSASQ